MPIQFRCPECRKKLSVSRRKAGAQVACPACGRTVDVPALADQPAAEAPVASAAAASAPAEAPVLETAVAESDREERTEIPAARPFIGLPAAGLDDDDAGGITFRKQGGSSDEMDLTPMVDVTFLLLIFFMITAAFSLTKTIEVPPPDPAQQGAQQTQTLEDLEKNSIMVRIDSQNAIFVEDEPVGDPAGLVDVLAGRRTAEDKHELILQADAQALHETVVLVLDAANEVQFTRIRLAALQDAE